MTERVQESGTVVRETGSQPADPEQVDREKGSDEEQVKDPVEELGARELGSEVPHEERADGSLAYFGDREQADQAAPRERGTNTGGQQ